jgi:hypothetical protein
MYTTSPSLMMVVEQLIVEKVLSVFQFRIGSLLFLARPIAPD